METLKKFYYKTREDGVNIFRTYSEKTPYLKQLPTGVIYECWVYKLDENGNETKEVDWENSGVFDVENAPYIYVEISEEEYKKESMVLDYENN